MQTADWNKIQLETSIKRKKVIRRFSLLWFCKYALSVAIGSFAGFAFILVLNHIGKVFLKL